MKITIDIRETRLLKHYGKYIDGKWTPKSNAMSFQQLDVADVIFYQDEKPVVLIERKEIKDLSSCVSSGSYKEQKFRMLKFQQENPDVRLIYLVENFSLSKLSDLNRVVNPGAPKSQKKTIQVLLSCIVGTMLRDNFFVMTTQGFEGTVAFIDRIFNKFPSYKSELTKRHTNVNVEYLKNLKVTKKENITPKNWFIKSLAQIQGISVEKAECISKVYGSFKDLIDNYEKLDNLKEREQMLKDISCGTRKLGPVCSKRIYQYLNI